MDHCYTKAQFVNETGEEIIIEGICNKTGLTWKTCSIYCYLVFFCSIMLFTIILAPLFIFVPLLIFLCIFSTIKSRRTWRLYLTNAGIHYHHTGHWGCSGHKWFIPISDIKTVSVPTHELAMRAISNGYVVPVAESTGSYKILVETTSTKKSTIKQVAVPVIAVLLATDKTMLLYLSLIMLKNLLML